MKNTLTQLFWPKSSLNKEGYIIGWSIRGFTCCIIAVYKADFQRITQVLWTLGEKAEILGIVGKEFEAIEAKSTSDIWISAESRENSVVITDLHCCGYKYKANAHIILFDNTQHAKKPWNFICPAVFFRKICNYSNKLKKPELSTFQILSEKINRCKFVEELIKKNLEPNFPPREISKELVKNVWGTGLVLMMKDFAELCNSAYCFKFPLLNISIQNIPYHSKFAHQLISRLRLLREWDSTRKHVKPKYSSPYISRSYTNSYVHSRSAFCTVLIDFMFGLIFLFLLYYFSTDTLVIVHTLGSTLHIEVLKSEVNWLMGLPAGFKPNEALDNAVGTNILLLIDSWNYLTTYLTKSEAEIVQFFAIFGFFGMSFQLALLSDLIDFCTLHM